MKRRVFAIVAVAAAMTVVALSGSASLGHAGSSQHVVSGVARAPDGTTIAISTVTQREPFFGEVPGFVTITPANVGPYTTGQYVKVTCALAVSDESGGHHVYIAGSALNSVYLWWVRVADRASGDLVQVLKWDRSQPGFQQGTGPCGTYEPFGGTQYESTISVLP